MHGWPLLAVLLVLTQAEESDSQLRFYDTYKVRVDSIPLLVNAAPSIEWNSLSNFSPMNFSVRGFSIMSATWDGVPVLVKQLQNHSSQSEELKAILLKEIALLRRLKHQHVIELLAYGDEPLPFAVFESILDSNLASVLNYRLGSGSPFIAAQRPQILSVNTTLSYASQIASAMTYLHEEWRDDVFVIHGGLFPMNIAFNRLGTVKLLNLGESVLVRRPISSNTVFDLPLNIGHWKYNSPEILSKKKYNFKTDVFSFSYLLYHMITGRHPIKLDSNIHIYLHELLSKRWRPLIVHTWKPSIQTLLALCWNKDILSRPNFSEIVIRLKTIMSEDTSTYQINPPRGSVTEGMTLFYH